MSSRQSFGFNRSRSHHPPVMQQPIPQQPPTLIEMVTAIYQMQQEILERLDNIERRINMSQLPTYPNNHNAFDNRYGTNNPYNQQPLVQQQSQQPRQPSTESNVFN